MNLNYAKKLPTPKELRSLIPISEELLKNKKLRDKEIRDIFTSKSNKFILIIGPCSADNQKSVLDYMLKLRELQEEVKDKILMIPRIYTNKPRTTGEGYKGMVHQPDPEKAANMIVGIKAIRSLHIKVGEETGFTCADEMLYPENHEYLEDILSYVAIGARSVENQQHRLTASAIDIPVGMKNPMSGDISVMLNAIRAAQVEQDFSYRGYEVNSPGNDLTHAIMRGYLNQYGRNFANYHYEDLLHLINTYKERGLKNPAIIIDTNHSNSNKNHLMQPRIANEILRNMNEDPILKKYVKGLMVESYIEGGAQKIGNGNYGQSITDPCLSFMDTIRMVYSLAEKL